MPKYDIDTPIEVWWCKEHNRWEWRDRLDRRGGVGQTLDQIKRTLVREYRCPCGRFHVMYVKLEDKLIDFNKFIESVKEEI